MNRTASAASPYLRRAVVDNAIALVSSAAGGRCNVMTASFFAESSHLPVLLRVAISPAAWTHELIEQSDWFGLSVLARGQKRWAIECGHGSGRERRRLEEIGLHWQPGPAHVPLLPQCLTTSACRVVERIGAGDHTLFVGEVTESYRQTRIAYRETLLVSDLVDVMAQ